MITLDNSYKTEVIDVHGHLGNNQMAYVGGGSAAEIVEAMNLAGVDKMCLSSFIGIRSDFQMGNDLIAEAISNYPDRILGYATINPNIKDYESELDRCFNKLNMAGIKIHTDCHDYPFCGENYIPALEYANSNKLPMLVHGPGKASEFRKICEKYTDINFLIAHVTHNWDTRSELPVVDVDLVRSHSNVYCEISSQICYYNSIEALVDLVGSDKVVFGSDHAIHDVRYQLGRIIYADISNSKKHKILYKNASQIFN